MLASLNWAEVEEFLRRQRVRRVDFDANQITELPVQLFANDQLTILFLRSIAPVCFKLSNRQPNPAHAKRNSELAHAHRAVARRFAAQRFRFHALLCVMRRAGNQLQTLPASFCKLTQLELLVLDRHPLDDRAAHVILALLALAYSLSFVSSVRQIPFAGLLSIVECLSRFQSKFEAIVNIDRRNPQAVFALLSESPEAMEIFVSSLTNYQLTRNSTNRIHRFSLLL